MSRGGVHVFPSDPLLLLGLRACPSHLKHARHHLCVSQRNEHFQEGDKHFPNGSDNASECNQT